MVDYPVDFPMESLALVTKALRTGDLSDVDCLAKAGWNVQGFAMNHLIGSGLHAVGAAAPPAERAMSQEKAIDEIDAFLAAQGDDAGPRAVGAAGPGPHVVGAFPVPWGILLTLSMKLLERIAARQLKG